MSIDKTQGWVLLESKDSLVVEAGLNAIDGQIVDQQRAPLLKQCLKNDDAFVRSRVSEVIAVGAIEEVAEECLSDIIKALGDVASLPGGIEECESKSEVVGVALSCTECNYLRYSIALARMRIKNSSLHRLAEQLKGDVRRTVVVAMGMRRDKSARTNVIDLAKDPDAGLFRAFAILTMGRIGTIDDIEFLKSIQITDNMIRQGWSHDSAQTFGPTYPIRTAAKHALIELEENLKSEQR